MAGLENIPDQMLACQVVEFKQPYKIHHVPVPKDLQPHDLLIKTAVASLCHTDNMVREGIFQPKLPSTASHEGAGTVAAMGSAVTDFHIGDRVMAGLYLHACGVCDDCKVDLPQYCQKSEGAIGVNTQGCFAEYVRIDARTAAKLPDAVTFGTAAPLACAGCTIFRAIKQAGVKKGEWLGLVGAGGGLGHLGIQFAKALGVKVLGVDARDEGLALARKTGADVVLDARKGKEAVVEAAQQATGGEGVHATVNISEASSAAATSCAITRRHGLMVQIAQSLLTHNIARQPDQVSVPFFELIFRDIRIHSSLVSSPTEAREMLQVVAEHGVRVAKNPVHGLQAIPQLLDLAHSGNMSGKGIVIVDPAQIELEKKIGATV
ncbi:chaperonin 10-like protein [Phyllosticta paracitricarpa]|uniref:Chaperonin 10-like protein n=1 Tax=Phyllosticta paracitricarpa TaxID=2016321 RepID=A0ABR1MX80_9PEZI